MKKYTLVSIITVNKIEHDYKLALPYEEIKTLIDNFTHNANKTYIIREVIA